MTTPIAKTPAPGPGEVYDTLEAIVGSLGRLEAAEAKRQGPSTQDLSVLLEACRSSLEDRIGALHNELLEVTQALQMLQAPALTPLPRRWPWWLQTFGGILGGALLMAGVWWCWPVSPYAHLAGGLDTLLVQSYASLPRPVQDQVLSLYTRYNVQAPNQRQKGTK